MEDPRLSRMYASIVARNVGGLWERFVDWISLNATRLVWMAVLGLVIILPLGWAAHTRGRFSLLKSHIREKISPPLAQAPRPGGQDALVLQRALLEGGGMPEFVSATLLPGRGLNTLQITAYLPGKGEVALLSAPSVAQAAVSMDGQGPDVNGGVSLRMGGAIEVPWAGRIYGTPSSDGTHVFTQWRGHSLTLPITTQGTGGAAASVGGMLLGMGADSLTTNVMPDGGEAQAFFDAGSFGDHWPGKTEVSMTVLLSSHVLDLRVTARNVGTEAAPVGIGWQPRLLVPSGDREQVTLRMPTGDRMEMQRGDGGAPTGRLLPVTGTPFDFTARGGARLGPGPFDEGFVHLRPAILDFGPAAELSDPKSNYRLRITAMTPGIREMRVSSPAGAKYVVIAPQLNYDDPLGKEWPMGENTGMVVLQPGQSVQWKVRLELFTTAAAGPTL
ncbi:MAG: hypothetical protein NVSMB3_10570 [Acidobacteriaceae bacterium]